MGKTKIIICFLLISIVGFAQLSKSDLIWIEKGKHELKIKPSKYDYKIFTKPYKVVRINEHEIQLINKKDTIVLYLENTYQFQEKIVFVKKNN